MAPPHDVARIEQKLDTIIELFREELALARECLALARGTVEENRDRLQEVRALDARHARFMAKEEALVDVRLAEIGLVDAQNAARDLLRQIRRQKAEESQAKPPDGGAQPKY